MLLMMEKGATCRYKTINTSFRGPVWKPVRSPPKSSSPSPFGQKYGASKGQSAHVDRPRTDQAVSRDRSLTDNALSRENNGPHHQKNSAKVVFKAFGKWLSVKGKTAGASGQLTHSIARAPEGDRNQESVEPSLGARKNPKPFRTEKQQEHHHHHSRPSPFQQRKAVFEKPRATLTVPPNVSYSWERPRKSSTSMANVASFSHAAESVNLSAKRRESANGFKPELSEEEDPGESTVMELEGLLRQYTDLDKRVKIQEAIHLLKQSLQEGDSTLASNQSIFSTPTETSRRKENSAAPKISSSSPSRFVGRSASLRNQRVPSQPSPVQAVHRANSVQLPRPKDFIAKIVDNSTDVIKVSENLQKDVDRDNDYISKQSARPATEQNESFFSCSASPRTNFGNQGRSPFNPNTVGEKAVVGSYLTSSTAVRAPTASVLRRSESAKENQLSGALHPISVVHGNLRRSKSILGRILGQRIGAEQTPVRPGFLTSTVQQQRSTFKSDSNEQKPIPIRVFKEPENSSDHTPKLYLGESDFSSAGGSTTSLSSSEQDHVYKVEESDSYVSSSEPSDTEFGTLPKDIRETCELLNHKTYVPPRSRSQSQELKSEKLFQSRKKTPRSDIHTRSANKRIRLPSSAAFSESDRKRSFSDDNDRSSDSGSEIMDRYSSRALQNRVSVKSQIIAKEDDVDANFASKVPSPKRLRNRRNNNSKPLNTGNDLKSRIQKYNDQPNGESAVGENTALNRYKVSRGRATVDGKQDLPKFNKSSNEDVEVSFSAGKTTVTITTVVPHSTSHAEDKPYVTGLTMHTESNSDEKSRKFSSGSAAEDNGRTRRARRSKLGSTTGSGADMLERASKATTKELKEFQGSPKHSKNIMSTEKCTGEAKFVTKGDLNNNTKLLNGDEASSKGGTDRAQDSLNNWSARRRKAREQKLSTESSFATHSTGNEKFPEMEEAIAPREMKATLKHVTHSAPALAEMERSLSGYTVKLRINGHGTLNENEKGEIELKEEAPRKSRIRTQYSRSSDNGSPTSSSNDNSSAICADVVSDTLAAMDVEVKRSDSKDETAGYSNHQSKTSGCDVTKPNAKNENRRREAQGEINKKETTEKKVPAEGARSCEIAGVGEEIVENGRRTDDLSEETPGTIDSSFKTESKIGPREIASQTEKQHDQVPDASQSADQIQEPKGRTRRRRSNREEAFTTNQQYVDKPARMHRRKDGEEAAKKTDETPESKPRTTHGRHQLKLKKSQEKLEENSELLIPQQPEVKNSIEQITNEKREEVVPQAETETDVTAERDGQASAKEEVKVEEPKAEADEAIKTEECSRQDIEDISDIKLLEKMLDASEDYDYRRRIRSVIRALKRGQKPTVFKDPDAKSAKHLAAIQSLKSRKNNTGQDGVTAKSSLSRDGASESRLTSRTTVTRTDKADLGSKYSFTRTTTTTTSTRMTSSGQKKIGSIFDRGVDDEEQSRKSSKSSSSSRMADLERRQAERKRELQRNRSMPASSSKDARKALVAKLESGTPKAQQGKKVGRSPTFVVPNANNVKQMLLKWCQSKTRGYEHVDIMNFSSSWASGMAFCALVHNFFPDAFDYGNLDPKNRAENLDLAFKKADEHGDIAQLLEAEDMISTVEPDWKCVYTYIGEFYKRIRDLGLN